MKLKEIDEDYFSDLEGYIKYIREEDIENLTYPQFIDKHYAKDEEQINTYGDDDWATPNKEEVITLDGGEIEVTVEPTNEQLKDAIITISHISGPDDINSPHTLDIPSTYRFEGFYQEVNFEDKIQLVDGASYEISIIATDMAKNTAETIIISNVTFDITPPILSVIAPIENSY